MIEIRNLSKKYPGNNFYSCDKINLCIGQGEIIGFLGSNGAGKTTLIKMISGLVTPSDGEVKIDGIIKSESRRTQIGVVLEGARNVYNFLSIEENLKYFGYLNRIDKNGGFSIDELLNFFDLEDKKHVQVNKLSRGMQQKVAIMIALMKNPDYLILDEPTIALDVESKLKMKIFLKELSTKYDKTIIISSHDMDVIESVCEKVAIFKKGKLLAFETITELKKLHEEKFKFRVMIEKNKFTNEFIKENSDIFVEKHTDYLVCFLTAISEVNIISQYILQIETVETSIEEIYLRLMEVDKSEHS